MAELGIEVFLGRLGQSQLLLMRLQLVCAVLDAAGLVLEALGGLFVVNGASDCVILSYILAVGRLGPQRRIELLQSANLPGITQSEGCAHAQ